PLSVVINVVGLALLVMRGAKDTMDVEFLGGVNAEVQIKKAFNDQFDDAKLRGLIEAAGTEIENAGRQLAQATVSPIEGEPAAFKVSAPGVSAPLLLAMVAEPLESGESGKLLQPRVGAQVAPGGEDAVILRVKNEVTAESLRNAIVALADNTGDSLPGDGENVRRANIGQVRDVGAQTGGKAWSITTVCGNKKLVQYALVSALGDKLDTKPRVTYVFHGNGDQPYPITEKSLAELPGMPPGVQGNLTDFVNGAAIYLDELNPPQDVDVLRTRLRNMRLQPDYADIPYRTIELFGVTPTGAKNEDGHPLFSSVVVAVVDDKHPYSGDASLWASEFAMPEKALVQAALENEQTLRRVTSFKPQIASQSRNKALVAVGLSWLMIIAYMWVRFGKMRYGVAGVVALVHDVCIALSFIGISGWVGGVNHPIGSLLLIEDFKIDMTIIAAIMTIIGFSINDTIVIFDRVRETRGRLGRETIDVVNRSINETLSRTVLTTGTVMLTLIAMYIFGGIGIRGFTFCMVIGCITGTYSTLAIASPLLLWRMVSSDEEKAYQARLATA
ncbi:MAG: protein translocase subunit SecF, partial [Planctomycetes bacterium]|nr:protein translocase subunit SecF [Planctomycetota bacterium]